MVRKIKWPGDANQLAKTIVDLASGEVTEPMEKVDDGKNPAAVAFGRLRGAEGGKATRLTNAFSMKVENQAHVVAPHKVVRTGAIPFGQTTEPPHAWV